jgi:hypothetical protein
MQIKLFQFLIIKKGNLPVQKTQMAIQPFIIKVIKPRRRSSQQTPLSPKASALIMRQQ